MAYSAGQLTEHRDEAYKEIRQKESELITYINTFDVSGVRKIIRAYLDGKCLKDMVKIAEIKSPIRFLSLDKTFFLPSPNVFKKLLELNKSN